MAHWWGTKTTMEDVKLLSPSRVHTKNVSLQDRWRALVRIVPLGGHGASNDVLAVCVLTLRFLSGTGATSSILP